MKALTKDDVLSITDAEFAFSTTRFLPDYSDLPTEYKEGLALGCKIADALFFGGSLPDLDLKPKPGFEDVGFDQIRKFTIAHLRSWAPKHEHKIAGVGWLIEQMFEITEPKK